MTVYPSQPDDLLLLGELDLPSVQTDTPETPRAPGEGDPKEVAAAMLLGGTIGAAIGNFIPDPGDIAYVAGQRWLTKKYQARQINEKELWAGELLVYYLPSFTWWSVVSLLTYKTKGLRPKIAVVSGLVAGGAIVSLIVHYIISEKSH